MLKNIIPCYLNIEIEVLFYIIKKKSTTLNDVSASLGVSKRIVKENIIKINTSMEDYFSVIGFIVSNNFGSICVNSNYKYCSLEYAYNLRLYLLKSNVLFNCCVKLVTHSKISREHLIRSLFISEYYLPKLIHKLNIFFEEFGITILNNQGIYCLEGNELSIRLFSYLFLQDAFQEVDWPFEDIPKPQQILQNSDKWASTKKRALYLLYTVLSIRVADNKFLIAPFSKDMMSFFEIIYQDFDISSLIHPNFFSIIKLGKSKKIEMLYFSFLSRIFLPYIFSMEQKKKLGKYFSASEHPFCILAKKIFTKIASLINVNGLENDERKYLYLYYIVIFNAWCLLNDENKDALSFYIPFTHFELPQNTLLFSKIKEEILSVVNDRKHTNLLSNLICSLSISEKKGQLSIYIQVIKSFTTEIFIRNRLTSFYNKQNIYITDSYDEADIVITDTYERFNKSSGKEIFYLDSIEDELILNELNELIRIKYREKLRNN